MHNASDRRSAAIVIALLFVFMLINFADKAALGLVAVPLMKELDLSADQFGVVAGTFFSLFAISGVIVGFLANRIAAKPLLGALALIWTVAQLPLALATASMPLLIACRVLLGAGEGPAYPLALHACYKWVPNGKRNIPTAIIMQGGQAGMLLAGPVVTLLTIHYGWRSAFLVLGVAGLAWMVLWQLFSKEGPLDQAAPAAADSPGQAVPYRRLLLDPTYIGSVAVYWTAYWVVAIIFTWIPSYLQNALGYPASQSGWMFSLFIAINIPVSLLGAYASEAMLRRGCSSRLARGVLTAMLTLLGAALILLAVQAEMPRDVRTVLLALGCSLPQISFVLCPAIVGEISPVRQRGAALAICNSIATTAGLIAPIVMGRMIGAGLGTAGYQDGLTCSAAVLAAGAMVCLLTVNSEGSLRRVGAIKAA